MVADLPTLKRRFVRALDKRTERETVSLRTRIRNAQDGDKRDVFDDGLLLWADSLAECTAEYAGHFCSIPKTQRPEDSQGWAEEQAWTGLGDFLGVNFTTEPSQWPEQNRVRQFILETCPSGPQLPKWFDLGLMQISRIRVKEETARMEATGDLDEAIKRIDTRLARLDEQRTEKQEAKAPAGAWDNLIPWVLADPAKLTDSADEPTPSPRLSKDDSARRVQAVYDRFAKLLFGDLALELDSGGVSVLAEGTVPSKGEASESGNAFIRSATGWIVRYKGNEKAFSDKVGFSMIQLALKNAGAALWPNEVERLCGPEVAVADVSTEDRKAMLKASTKQEAGDLAYIKELLKDVQSYDKKIQDAPKAEAAMLRQEQEEKRSFLQKLTRPGGAPKKLGSDEGKSAKRVNTNVTRAVREITQHIPDLGKHLNSFLKAGVQVIYLEKSTTWQFK
jgi:hypothetical protein